LVKKKKKKKHLRDKKKGTGPDMDTVGWGVGTDEWKGGREAGPSQGFWCEENRKKVSPRKTGEQLRINARSKHKENNSIILPLREGKKKRQQKRGDG